MNQIDSHTATQQLTGFAPGVQYLLKAYCWCLYKDPQGHPVGYGWAPIGEIQFTYPEIAPSNTARIRIRSVLTSQCTYVEAYSFAAKHWVCWPDPKMTFYRDDYADGTTMFRDAASGRCLWGGFPNLAPTGTRYCGALGTRFRVVPAGGNRVRLFVPLTGLPPFLSGYGGCYYADGGNGGAMLKEPCTGSERSQFVLDPV